MKNLMKIFLLGLVSLSGSMLYAQNIGISGGALTNSFYDFARDQTPHFSSSNGTGEGYVFCLYLNDVPAGDMSLMFHLRHEKYTGTSYSYTGGLGGGSGIQVLAEKQKIGLVIYPVNFEFDKRIEINFGMNFNFLIASQSEARRSSWQMGMGTTYTPIEGEFDSAFDLGPQMRMAFKIPLGQNWALVPQVQFYWGWLDELQGTFNHDVRSIRVYGEIGIQRKVN